MTMHAMIRWLSGMALMFAFSQTAHADDWAQWRGPHRDGHSAEAGLLKEWPTEGPKLLYKVAGLGGGYSTPSVVGDRIYLLNDVGLEDEFVRCLNAADGSEVWSTRIGKVGHPEQQPAYPGARTTPTVVGDVLYALGSDGDLACLETATGSIRWTKSFQTDFGGKYGEWAYSESPLVDGDLVVVTPGGPEATMVALHAGTGEVVWKCADPQGDVAAYASIVVAEFGGVKQYVQFVEKGVIGVDAATGKLLWKYGKTAEGSPANIPTPVISGDLVYSATNRGGAGAARVARNGDAFSAEEVYFDKSLPRSIGGSVLVGDHLYGTSPEGLMCIEFATGKVAWKDRSIGASSVLYADGLLILHGEKGEVALVEATPDAYHELGRFTPVDTPFDARKTTWTYPVLADGRLYLHDFGTLWCFEVSSR
ncbi:MAG: PQQ-like beta-propeller repeat protein [Planctomycetaceae bacterium]|nr:PQQ-like beta-propeller repeat protein [Planctomycetaceae bacterium]